MLRLAGNLIAIVAMTIILCQSRNSLIAAQESLATFNKLVEQAKSLESAQAELHGERNANNMYAFIYEPKGAVCNRYYKDVQAAVDQYYSKALDFVKDSEKPKGWFSGFVRAMGPLNSMRQIGKNFRYLAEATEDLSAHSNVDKLSDEDVKCKLAKFQSVAVNNMLFVLQTDAKYLVTEKSSLISLAILRQLKQAKFKAEYNFDDIKELSPAQRHVMKKFYLDRVNRDATDVGRAAEHFDEPSTLVVGRLHESCESLVFYTETMQKLDQDREEVCSRSKLAAKEGEPTGMQPEDQDTVDFCQAFLNSV